VGVSPTKMTVRPLTPAPSEAISQGESMYENMYEMLIEDLLMMRFLMPRQAHLNLLAQLVARGHIGLQQFLRENGRPPRPSLISVDGSRDNLNLETQVIDTGNSPSA